MRPPKQIVLLSVLLVGVVSLPILLFDIGGPSADHLAERIAASEPRWNSYQEDIKGQIGAAPVAEWSGELLSAQASEGVITLRFALMEPWKSREVALPVLVHLPDGTILMPDATTSDEDHRLYRYALPSSVALPWAEVQYPHHRERLYFDAEGYWPSTP